MYMLILDNIYSFTNLLVKLKKQVTSLSSCGPRPPLHPLHTSVTMCFKEKIWEKVGEMVGVAVWIFFFFKEDQKSISVNHL